jgi:hypothetical protein
MKTKSCLVAVLTWVAITAAGLGQIHPNVERGIAADKMYQFGGLDQINAFNGNLSIHLPIGGSLPVSDRLSYGLTLTYNSKIWDSETITIPDGNQTQAFHRFPSRLCNAGLGWTLSLGMLLDPNDTELNPTAPFRYIGADGGSHAFYSTIHQNQNEPVTGALYTRDNTYLRLSTLGSHKLVEFPDGTIQDFQPLTVAGYTRWQLVQIRDWFGNHVDINYADPSAWVITDQYGRRTTVHFGPPPPPPPNDPQITQANYQSVIDYVDVPAFNNSSSVAPGVTARYVFSYDTQRVRRAYCEGEPQIAEQYDPGNVELPQLSHIQLPDGSSYDAIYAANPTPTTEASCPAGEIISLRLPTYGELQWVYRDYKLPIKGCGDPDALSQSAGIKERVLHDPNCSTCDARWIYEPVLTPEAVTSWHCAPGQTEWGSLPSDELKTTVHAPSGDDSVYYFSVWPLAIGTPPDVGATFLEYGLPFSRKTAKDGKFISTQIYQGTVASGALKRTNFVRYERDEGFAQFDANRRLADSRTEFNDDQANGQPHYRETDSTDFDGVGHYRTVSETGVFSEPEAVPNLNSTRVVTTAYNAYEAGVNASDPNVIATGTYPTGVIPFTPPATSKHWILNLFTSTTTTEGSASAKRQFCFAPATGFLKGTRTLGAPGIANTDLVAGFVSDSNAAGGAAGNATSEKYYGGDAKDNGGVDTRITSTTELCSMLDIPNASPGPLAFDVRHTFEHGVKKSSEYYSSGVSMGFKVLDVDIDANTGLVFHSRDTAGVQSVFGYDPSRRITLSFKPGTAGISYEYTNATSSAPAKVVAEQVSATAGTVRYEVQFDFLGRKSLEKRLMTPRADCPAECTSSRRTEYNGMGWAKSVSEWEKDTPSHFTSSENFDPFGKPGKVTRPDGKYTTFTYLGARQVTRTVGLVAAPEMKTTEVYDVHGRLIQVIDPNLDEPALKTSATYTYDVGNHLSNVNITDFANPSHTQTRSFTYDGRGFLQAEQHPETGVTTYGSYDARGHVGIKRVNGAEDIFDLNYFYDDAERLTSIKSRISLHSTLFFILKSFSFGPENDGINLKRGKLETAFRYNVLAVGDLTVLETYGYNDLAGRMTDKTTRIGLNGGPSVQTAQSYVYNDLDLVSRIIYPSCAPPGCGQPAWGEIDPLYANGALSGVPPFANQDSMSYDQGGNLVKIARANGMLDTYARDSMGRPSSITFDGYSACTQPSINTQPLSHTIYGSQVKLSVAASGSPTIQYQWFENGASTPIQGATQSTLTRTISQATTYQARVYNTCGAAMSAVASITVAPALPAPTGVVATASGLTVNVGWNVVESAHHYVVDRRASGSWSIGIASPLGTSYPDSGRTLNTAYLYRVRAVDADDNPSAYSNVDMATTMSFTPVFAGIVIPSVHFTELLNAVNAVLMANGSQPLGWPQGTQPVPGGAIFTSQLTFLRNNMNSALSALSLPTPPYTDPNPASVPVRAVHVTELQGRTQ